MLLVKITIMGIQYKAALLQLMEIAFEKSDDESHNLLIFKWWWRWRGNCEL